MRAGGRAGDRIIGTRAQHRRTRTSRRSMHTVLVSALLVFGAVDAYNNGVGERPQMGLNSWNSIGGDVSEAWARAAADALVTSGLRDVGYEYVCLGASRIPCTEHRLVRLHSPVVLSCHQYAIQPSAWLLM